jgi:hypothetical protein
LLGPVEWGAEVVLMSDHKDETTVDICGEVDELQESCTPLRILRAEFDTLRASYEAFTRNMETKLDKIVDRSNQILLALLAILGSMIVALVMLILRK